MSFTSKKVLIVLASDGNEVTIKFLVQNPKDPINEPIIDVIRTKTLIWTDFLFVMNNISFNYLL